MKGLKNFSTISNGLVKQFTCSTEEVITEDGYTDLVCTFKIKSSMLINGFLETIGVRFCLQFDENGIKYQFI